MVRATKIWIMDTPIDRYRTGIDTLGVTEAAGVVATVRRRIAGLLCFRACWRGKMNTTI
jgi:hypothetical protein